VDYFCFNAIGSTIKVSSKDETEPVNFCGIQVFNKMMYKIKDDYGYCLTVGNSDSEGVYGSENDHWVRTDESVYVVGTNDFEHCTYWTFDNTEQKGVYLITLAQNKDDYTD
jgi:hypothetical protein